MIVWGELREAFLSFNHSILQMSDGSSEGIAFPNSCPSPNKHNSEKFNLVLNIDCLNYIAQTLNLKNNYTILVLMTFYLQYKLIPWDNIKQ